MQQMTQTHTQAEGLKVSPAKVSDVGIAMASGTAAMMHNGDCG